MLFNQCGSVRVMLFNSSVVVLGLCCLTTRPSSVVVLGLCCLMPLECGSVRVMLFNTIRVW